MDQVLADTLTANLKAAKTVEAKVDALVLAEIAVVDCQRKTGQRVKEMSEEREADKNKRIGVKIALMAMVLIISIVGPTVAIKFCKVVGILW